MARGTGAAPSRLTNGTLFLDSQGLSLLFDDDLRMAARLKDAVQQDLRIATSVVTLVEAMNPKRAQPRWQYVLSRINVLDVTRPIADHAADLLRAAGLHGHKYAIDAIVAATAMAQPGPTRLCTSDVDDVSRLCDGSILLIAV
ncbi:putative nucleic acid-binding protein [Streptacidiphilus sp. MAP12-20]|uniref:PIN domain-containing protein n=1 Tax=Streptacidiphilus sp. MAP12-20 TaxID=3156299 RepID=UPI003518F4C7